MINSREDAEAPSQKPKKIPRLRAFAELKPFTTHAWHQDPTLLVKRDPKKVKFDLLWVKHDLSNAAFYPRDSPVFLMEGFTFKVLKPQCQVMNPP